MMRVVSAFLIVSLLTSALAATVRSGLVDETDYKVYNTRQSTEAGKKCAGAPGYPYVHYAPCPEKYECREKDHYAHGEWGLFCLPMLKTSVGKCYKDGERCMGAKGKPYVPYHACCSPSSVCMEDAKLGWGSFCADIGYEYESPKEEMKSVEKHFGHGKCHVTGARCLGAPGYPYVEYGDGCCSAKEKCVVSKKYGPWGGFCVKEEEEEKKEEDDEKDVEIVFIYKDPVEEKAKKEVFYKEYGYPVEKEEKDDSGKKFWGPKSVWEPKCINTNYFGCKVVAENEFYYRQAVVSRMGGGGVCCKASDICYRGYCKAKEMIPHGRTGGKPVGGSKVKVPKNLLPKMSPSY